MIGYYRIQSPLSDGKETFLGALASALGEEVKQISLEEYLSDEAALLYVATGGSEGYFLKLFDRIRHRHCYILTSGDKNSLAASMEILSFLRNHGGSGEILHGSIGDVARKIKSLTGAHAALKKLSGKTLGCIGAPSDWLIASDYDSDAVRKKLGLGFVTIPMAELLSEIKKGAYRENEYTELLEKQGFDGNELKKALQVFGAFERIVEKYALAGVSVRCFDLLDSVHTTGCLGIAILNSLGVYGGCEGDMPSLLSMAILGSVTGEGSFMCNPCRFDTKEGTAVFAHCTVPMNILSSFALDTHFESGIGVAVRGVFRPGDCTVFKCAGNLGRYYAEEGFITEMPFSETLCRTQVKVKLKGFDYFLTDPIHNHHILCRGRQKEKLDAFFWLLGEKEREKGDG